MLFRSQDIGIVTARNRREAKAEAAATFGDCCYANQRLEVSARYTAARWNALLESLAVNG